MNKQILLFVIIMLGSILTIQAMEKPTKQKKEIKVATFSQQYLYSRFSVDFKDADFFIEGYNGNGCQIEIFYTEEESGTANFCLEKDNLFLEDLNNENDVNVLEVKIVLPNTVSVEIETVSGNVKVKNFKNLNKILLSSASGDLYLKNILGVEKIEVETKSGDAKFKNVKAANNTLVSLVSGDVNFYACDILKQFIVESVSGDVNIFVSNIGVCSVASVSGDVYIVDSYIGSFNVSTVSGDINAKKSKFDFYDYSTISGDSNIGKVAKEDSKNKSSKLKSY